MQVRLLGSIDVMVDGVARLVPGRRRQAVLAVLGLRPGESVSTDQLVDIVWGERAPATASNTLQRHVSHIRRLSGVGASLVARSRGYVLDVAGEVTDVQAAERLIREGQHAVDQDRRAARLKSALTLWRGEALADVCDLSWLDEQARRLAGLRHSAVRALIEARLMMGEHAQLVPELQHLADQHPYDEDIHGQLMLALHRTGRKADALATFQRLRRTLGDELGVDPGPALRELQAAILRHDRALDPPAPPIAVAPAPASMEPAPAQLPAAVRGFVGRECQLARLDAVLAEVDAERPAVAVAAVSGTAGVGKTALAVHWAHRVAGRFPDGQLYVNLRGFEPGGQPTDPFVVLHRFLAALGMPVPRIPVDPDGRAAAYRSRLTGRRMLIVLDNARDAEQVRPLLPGSPGCFVLVTSRDRLTPLIATEGAVPVPVDLMSTADSRELLERRLGAAGTVVESDAVADIIGLCAGLPLALVVVAARTAGSTAVQALEVGAGALDALQGGDATTDIRSVFLASYVALSRDAAALFRVLGVHPGPCVGLAAAAAGAAVPMGRARVLMAELTRANLVGELPDGRYALHDLLRAYALERAELDESELDRHAVLNRVLDHYLRQAYDAADLIEPNRGDVTRPPRLVDDRSEITDLDGAVAWFTIEHQVLLAAVERAAAAGFPTHAWHLAWTMAPYLHTRGHWHDQVTIGRTVLAALGRAGDPSGQVQMHRALAAAYSQLGHLDSAADHYDRANELAMELGDHRTAARTHLGLAWLAERRGEPRDGLTHARRALALYRTCDDRPGQTKALNMIGWTHALVGEYDPAQRMCAAALALARVIGDHEAQAWTLDSLGYIQRQRGDHRRAIDHYLEALGLFEKLADPYTEAGTLIDLGDTYEAAGELEAARASWRRALGQAGQHPGADRVRAKLATR